MMPPRHKQAVEAQQHVLGSTALQQLLAEEAITVPQKVLLNDIWRL